MSTPIAVHRPGDGPRPAPAGGAPGAAPSKLSKLKKPGILAAAGVGLVVLIALMRGGGGGAAADATGNGTGTSTFDSTSNDVYNSIQPEIDKLTQELEDLQNKQPTGPTPPGIRPPVYTPPPPGTVKPPAVHPISPRRLI